MLCFPMPLIFSIIRALSYQFFNFPGRRRQTDTFILLQIHFIGASRYSHQSVYIWCGWKKSDNFHREYSIKPITASLPCNDHPDDMNGKVGICIKNEQRTELSPIPRNDRISIQEPPTVL